MTQLVAIGPFGELDLGYKNWFDPVAAFHFCQRDSLSGSLHRYGAAWPSLSLFLLMSAKKAVVGIFPAVPGTAPDNESLRFGVRIVARGD